MYVNMVFNLCYLQKKTFCYIFHESRTAEVHLMECSHYIMLSLSIIHNYYSSATFNNFSEKHIVWALSLPSFKDSGSILSENHQSEIECSIRILKTVFWHVVINGVITHKKLPQMQGYHIFPSSRGVYLPKNHYEN